MTALQPQFTPSSEEDDNEENEIHPTVDGLKHLQRWKAAYHDCLAALQAPDRETRLTALTTLTTNISAAFVGLELDDDRTTSGLLSRLFNIVRHPASVLEHNHALTFICIACLQQFDAFEPIANAFVREFLPTLPNLADEHAFRFYAIAVVAAFGLVAEGDRALVLARYCQLFATRAISTPGVIVECLKGLCVMLACFPLTVSLPYAGQLSVVISSALAAKHPAVLAAALDLLLLLHECQYRNDDETLPQFMTEVQFIGNFIGKLSNVPALAPKKAIQQSLTKHCNKVKRAFAGEVESTAIVIASQSVRLPGFRKSTFIDVVRRLTKGEFGAQMASNVLIHRFLGISLMTQRSALAMKKKIKPVIESNRTSGKRTREQAIAKKRRQKENREEVSD
jgi:hypothetical protein